MANDIQYEISTWNQAYDMLLNIAQKIQTHPYEPDIIVGIAKGGLVPARILTDLLETPQLVILQIEFYVDIAQTKQEPILRQALTSSVNGKRVLLADDIADTGKTLQLATNHLQQQGAQEIKTTTLYLKPESIIKPDFYGKQTSNWVIFPWDVKETLRKILQKQTDNQIDYEFAKLVKAGLPKQLADRLLNSMQ